MRCGHNDHLLGITVSLTIPAGLGGRPHRSHFTEEEIEMQEEYVTPPWARTAGSGTQSRASDSSSGAPPTLHAMGMDVGVIRGLPSHRLPTQAGQALSRSSDRHSIRGPAFCYFRGGRGARRRTQGCPPTDSLGASHAPAPWDPSQAPADQQLDLTPLPLAVPAVPEPGTLVTHMPLRRSPQCGQDGKLLPWKSRYWARTLS